VFSRQGKFNCTNVCGTMSPIKRDTELDYYHHVLNQATGPFVRHDINPKLMNGVMAKIRVPVPPVAEQADICQCASVWVQTTDELAEIIGRQIASLQEYRQALITAAVTGKIDVREEVSACLQTTGK
jgi:type I restriction enzyme S subunit